MKKTFTQNNTEAATLTVAVVNLLTIGAQLAAPKALSLLSRRYVRGPLRGVLAAGAIECAYLGIKGELTKEKAAKVMGSTLTSWAAAETGALVGSIAGPAGAIVGGIVGGAIGYTGFNRFFKTEVI